MRASPLTWLIRAVWLTLPLTLGELISSALAGRSGAVATTVATMSWAVWAAVLLSAMVLQPVSLVVLRMLTPLAVLGGTVAAIEQAPDLLGWIGLASVVVVSVVSLSAEVGLEFINGASYGDERRYPLRPPAALLLGPVPLVWSLVALPLPVGVLLLAAGRWIGGTALVVVGAATAWWGSLVLARLTRRWCVFVPAGITLVDDMALVDPTLMRAEDVVRLGPAAVDTDALDLSAGAAGLILQVDLAAQGSVVPAARRGAVTEAVETSAVLFAPSRPGALLAHAAERGLPVGP